MLLGEACHREVAVGLQVSFEDYVTVDMLRYNEHCRPV
jgi:hypothetical protein